MRGYFCIALLYASYLTNSGCSDRKMGDNIYQKTIIEEGGRDHKSPANRQPKDGGRDAECTIDVVPHVSIDGIKIGMDLNDLKGINRTIKDTYSPYIKQIGSLFRVVVDDRNIVVGIEMMLKNNEKRCFKLRGISIPYYQNISDYKKTLDGCGDMEEGLDVYRLICNGIIVKYVNEVGVVIVVEK
jgi:hypothetical protein